MTDTAENATPEVTAEVASTIRKGLVAVERRQVTLGEFVASVTTPATKVEPVPQPVARPTQITDRHRVALARLPEVFGRVNPTEVRALSQEEIDDLAEERSVIDTLSGLLKERKDTDIREFVANHFDSVAEADGLARREPVLDDDGNVLKDATPRDAKGHYVLKQRADSVKAGHYFERRPSAGTKPSVNGAALLAAYEDGKISREVYLACTRSVRVFDEERAREAIRKDPSVLFLLAEHATTPAGQETTSIYCPELKG